jgi:hypothetical protein
VLRGSALEIIDGHGKIRAELRIFPADSKHKLPDGDPSLETVLLRLIDPDGRPSVKLATNVRGGGLYLGARPTRPRPISGRMGRSWNCSCRTRTAISGRSSRKGKGTVIPIADASEEAKCGLCLKPPLSRLFGV